MTAIMMAVSLTMLIGFAALAVDVGYVMLTKNELQNIADATALGGARWLGDRYSRMTYAQQQAYDAILGKSYQSFRKSPSTAMQGGWTASRSMPGMCASGHGIRTEHPL